MKETEQQKELSLKLRTSLEEITQNNTGLKKSQIITIAIGRLYKNSNLKNKSKTAFDKEIRTLMKQRKKDFGDFL